MNIDIEACSVELSLPKDTIYSDVDGIKIYDVDVTGDSIIAKLWLPKEILNDLPGENAAVGVWVGGDEYAATFSANEISPDNFFVELYGQVGRLTNIVSYNYDIIAL